MVLINIFLIFFTKTNIDKIIKKEKKRKELSIK